MAASSEASGEALAGIYARLHSAYGPQDWWPSESAFETIVGAVLTQNTAWANVEKAIRRLRDADALSLAGLSTLDEPVLAELILPSGSYRIKARRLKAFCRMVEEEFGGHLDALLALPLDALRARLLSTYGVGPETADAILLYAAGKPSFVVDAYTRRIFQRLGLAPRDRSYDSWRRFFMSRLPADPVLFNEYHALIVEHGKRFCRKQPRCAGCALADRCQEGRSGAVAALAAAFDDAIR